MNKRDICLAFARYLKDCGVVVTDKHVNDFCRVKLCPKCGQPLAKYGKKEYCWTKRCSYGNL